MNGNVFPGGAVAEVAAGETIGWVVGSEVVFGDFVGVLAGRHEIIVEGDAENGAGVGLGSDSIEDFAIAGDRRVVVLLKGGGFFVDVLWKRQRGGKSDGDLRVSLRILQNGFGDDGIGPRGE